MVDTYFESALRLGKSGGNVTSGVVKMLFIVIFVSLAFSAYHFFQIDFYVDSEPSIPSELMPIVDDVVIDTSENMIELENLDSYDNIITYRVYDDVISVPVVNMTLSKWSELNPHLVFRESDTPILKIKPMDLIASYFIDYMVLGEYDADTETIFIAKHLNPAGKMRTLSHELGHFFGLDHHCDHDHLMFSDDDDCVENYDHLNYNIPKYIQECFRMPDNIIYCSDI